MLFYLQSGVGKLTHAMLAESDEGEQTDLDVYRIMRRWRTRVAGEGQLSVQEREREEEGGRLRERKFHRFSNLSPAARRLPQQNVGACRVIGGGDSWILIE